MDRQSESPELWAFLESLRSGDILSGTVAAIERFGVFVALDDGPAHPLFPGVGFITLPELSWRHMDAPTDVVEVGRRISCEFLQFDTYNAEARLSLRALEPDPLRAFADRTAVGQELRGTVGEDAPLRRHRRPRGRDFRAGSLPRSPRPPCGESPGGLRGRRGDRPADPPGSPLQAAG